MLQWQFLKGAGPKSKELEMEKKALEGQLQSWAWLPSPSLGYFSWPEAFPSSMLTDRVWIKKKKERKKLYLGLFPH